MLHAILVMLFASLVAAFVVIQFGKTGRGGVIPLVAVLEHRADADEDPPPRHNSIPIIRISRNAFRDVANPGLSV